MQGKNYYGILGLKRDATEEDIKRRYHKLALEWHPDRAKSKSEIPERSKKFGEISEAYEVLSDPKKRSVYDEYGEAGLKGRHPGAGGSGFPAGATFFTDGGVGGNYHPADPEQIFRMVFGTSSPFGKSTRGGSEFSDGGGFNAGTGDFFMSSAFPNQPKIPVTVTRALAVSLEDLYCGAKKKLKISRKLLNGTSTSKTITVEILPGYKPGTKITFKGEGDEINPKRSQDIVFVIEAKPHPVYTLTGIDLNTTITIPLSKALCGFDERIRTLDNRIITVSGAKDSPINPNDKVYIPGEGLLDRKSPHNNSRGKLIVTVQVKFPQNISEADKQTLKKIIPPF